MGWAPRFGREVYTGWCGNGRSPTSLRFLQKKGVGGCGGIVGRQGCRGGRGAMLRGIRQRISMARRGGTHGRRWWGGNPIHHGAGRLPRLLFFFILYPVGRRRRRHRWWWWWSGLFLGKKGKRQTSKSAMRANERSWRIQDRTKTRRRHHTEITLTRPCLLHPMRSPPVWESRMTSEENGVLSWCSGSTRCTTSACKTRRSPQGGSAKSSAYRRYPAIHSFFSFFPLSFSLRYSPRTFYE